MTRYDIYDVELKPGDEIVFLRAGEISKGKIQSITPKGTIFVFRWGLNVHGWGSIARGIRTSRIIKI